LEAKFDEAKQKEQTDKEKYQKAMEASAEMDRLVKEKEAKEREAKETVARARTELADLNRQKNELMATKASGLAKYHQNMPRAMDMIQRSRNQFKQLPIGPLGVHVKVKRQEWSRICEVIFGRNLNGFLVTNFEDQHTLKSILQKTAW